MPSKKSGYKKSAMILAVGALGMLSTVQTANLRNLQYNDNLCNTWNSDGSVCVKCSYRTYYNSSTKKCTQVSDQCNTFDTNNGKCLSCWPSYGEPVNGVCGTSPVDDPVVGNPDPTDPCAVYGYVDNKGVWANKWFGGCKTVCKSCVSGYYLDSSNKCQLNPSNCITADSSGKCTQCEAGYLKQADGTCDLIVSTPPTDHCVKYSYSDNSGKSFLSWFSGCKQVCTQCDSGYYLNSQKKCIQNPSNCLVADSTGKCTSCATGYSLANGVCTQVVVSQPPADDHCKTYSYWDKLGKFLPKWIVGCSRVCKQCDAGYYLNSQKKCIQNPSNCLVADSTGKCTSCATGYSLANGVCTQVVVSQPPADDHCKTYNYWDLLGKFLPKWVVGCNRVCKQCDAGYYLNSQKKCIQNPSNCLVADSTGKCTSCATGYSLANGVCTQVVVSQPPADDHCKTYNYLDVLGKFLPKWIVGCSRVCKQCDAGYYLNSQKKCIQNPSNCLVADSTGKCTSCATGYSLANGVCTQVVVSQPPADDHCKTYNYLDILGKFLPKWIVGCSRVCKQCDAGYYLNSQKKCIQNPSNCLVADSTGKCTSCATGYSLANGVCTQVVVSQPPADDHCKTYNYLDILGKFLPKWIAGCSRVCKQCDAGYYLNSQKKCIQNPSNCLVADSTGKCTSCATGYSLANGVCTQVVVSQPPADDHCKTYSYWDILGKLLPKWVVGCNRICKQCDTGYYLNALKQCKIKPSHCVNVDSNGKCTSCDAGYQVKNDACSLIVVAGTNTDPNCQSATGATCSACKPYFYLDTNKVCQPYPANCNVVNAAGKCTTCKTNYYVNSSGGCTSLPSHCTSADTAGKCTNCDSGFINLLGYCIGLPSNCKTVGADGKCTECNTNYKYVSIVNLCIKI